MTKLTLSILDLATVDEGGDIGAGLRATVDLARQAEASGYERVWYAEHHNMPSIASSATSVLIAHVAAHTKTIRLGAGGIMLPNHSPLVIAEQFGTLAELHPGRIDLGLGRAPGTDGATFRALRRSVHASDQFPQDVLELQTFLSDELSPAQVNAYPGRGTKIPLTILGSSLFGANLAAQLGLPYAFASHFAPDALRAAVAHYRDNYQPSEQHPEPHVIAGMNVVAAATQAEAEALYERVKISRVRSFLSRGREKMLTSDEAEMLMGTPAATQILGMLKHSAVGDRETVHAALRAFGAYADADEIITVHAAPSPEERIRSVEIAAFM